MTTTQASTGRDRLLDALEQGEMDTVLSNLSPVTASKHPAQ